MKKFALFAILVVISIIAVAEMQYNYFYANKSWTSFDFRTVLALEIAASDITVKEQYNGCFWMATSGDYGTATLNFSAQVLGNDKTILDAIVGSH